MRVCVGGGRHLELGHVLRAVGPQPLLLLHSPPRHTHRLSAAARPRIRGEETGGGGAGGGRGAWHRTMESLSSSVSFITHGGGRGRDLALEGGDVVLEQVRPLPLLPPATHTRLSPSPLACRAARRRSELLAPDRRRPPAAASRTTEPGRRLGRVLARQPALSPSRRVGPCCRADGGRGRGEGTESTRRKRGSLLSSSVTSLSRVPACPHVPSLPNIPPHRSPRPLAPPNRRHSARSPAIDHRPPPAPPPGGLVRGGAMPLTSLPPPGDGEA